MGQVCYGKLGYWLNIKSGIWYLFYAPWAAGQGFGPEQESEVNIEDARTKVQNLHCMQLGNMQNMQLPIS